jgi:hypothetical protein
MYTKMPFGCKNASAYCQRTMDYEIAKAGLQKFCLCFIDDLLVFSDNPAKHIRHVRAVLHMLKSCGLCAHPDGSVLRVMSLSFLASTSAGMS